MNAKQINGVILSLRHQRIQLDTLKALMRDCTKMPLVDKVNAQINMLEVSIKGLTKVLNKGAHYDV